jgi:hypothetical protein
MKFFQNLYTYRTYVYASKGNKLGCRNWSVGLSEYSIIQRMESFFFPRKNFPPSRNGTYNNKQL